MTELQRYIAEEIAEDHADGILTRREAVRRLGLLGLTGTAASTLLADFAQAASAAPATATKSPIGGESIGWGPVATQAITFPGRDGRTLQGAWAPAYKPRGSVLVIHENRGLNDHIRLVAGRLAASGWSALAIDLLSEEGGTAALPDDGARSAALAAAPPERFDADMQAGLTELSRRVQRKRIGAIGFCFGGGLVWRLVATKDRRLAAAAPFYGPFVAGTDFKGSRAAVLAVYGGLDQRVLATRDGALAAVKAAGLTHQFLTFTGADHAFFNDTGARFHAPSMAEANRRVLAWFDEYLKLPKTSRKKTS
jgi:carboxymethylenebutenolidase